MLLKQNLKHGHNVCSALSPEAAQTSSNSELATGIETCLGGEKEKSIGPRQECLNLRRPGAFPDINPSYISWPGYSYFC